MYENNEIFGGFEGVFWGIKEKTQGYETLKAVLEKDREKLEELNVKHGLEKIVLTE